ncbi:MAG: glycosyltransferase family 39 protein [Chloroflexia bacterium]|nr:glycosyltransferase family 39 protein [Chloroflexia bacterium]
MSRVPSQSRPPYRPLNAVIAITLAALALRLVVTHWHASYPLSGDEIGFFNQARTFVQGGGFHDMPFMRAPLYPLFLAVILRIFGAEVTAARLVQALLSTATIPLLYLWARRRCGHSTGLIAALLGALFFPLAVQATLLLSETLFLFLFVLGMALLEWRAGQTARWEPLLGGALFGLSALTRSIGLPLVLLAALCFALAKRGNLDFWTRLRPALLVLLGAALVILPWTVRNAVVHNAWILIDTTGSTNLWMDNDPVLGRDAVKAELLQYPEGERQAISVRQGLRSIGQNFPWFLGKCGHELRQFFSLEYFDDMIRRPAIWYPPAEVWARVLLGDGLGLLLLVAGIIGLVSRSTRCKAVDLFWLAYIPATTTLFHLELRYRLPFFLALLPYAAAALAQPRPILAQLRQKPRRGLLAGLGLLLVLGLMLSWNNYPQQGWQILRKRVHLMCAERSLQKGDAQSAAEQARSALEAYPESSEARVLLARALRELGRPEETESVLRQAIAYRSGHPHPHLLLGDLLRQQGRLEEAAAELAYESASLEDLQKWARQNFSSPPAQELDLGSHLALGHLQGWHLPERTGPGTSLRWSDDRVAFWLAAPPGPDPMLLTLRLSAGRPEGLPQPVVQLYQDGRELASFRVENGWHTYVVEVEEQPAGTVLAFELHSETFRPHRYDRHLDDNRPLGVMVDWVRLAR